VILPPPLALRSTRFVCLLLRPPGIANGVLNAPYIALVWVLGPVVGYNDRGYWPRSYYFDPEEEDAGIWPLSAARQAAQEKYALSPQACRQAHFKHAL